MSGNLVIDESASSPVEEDEECEEEDEAIEEELNDDPSSTEMKRHSITGRGVTLSMLIADNIIEPGEGLMSIDYLGKQFKGDLLSNGKILWKDNNQVFNSPSAWAIHCKKFVNPDKKSGCGWASVKYKGKKLDAYKLSWFRKHRQSQSPHHSGGHKSPATEVNKNGRETSGNGLLTGQSLSLSSQHDTTEKDDHSKLVLSPAHKMKKKSITEYEDCQDQVLNLSIKGPYGNKSEETNHSVQYSSLGRRDPDHDPNTLVECTTFESLGKIQPFTISMSTNCLLLIDFHCHLTTSEVVGYLVGKWDINMQHVSVLQAYPCRCRLGDKENAGIVEDEIRKSVYLQGLSLLGWYHSHPKRPANPSLRDIDSQMEYQLKMKGTGLSYNPCMGLIISPYSSDSRRESEMQAYWVMPPPENKPRDYGMPMRMNFSVQQDVYLSPDVLNEIKWLGDFYKGSPDMIRFQDNWHQTTTYLEKLKASLASKFPKDQTDGHFLEFIHNLLVS